MEKKLFLFYFLLSLSVFCFGTEVGQEIPYPPINTTFSDQGIFLTKVEPAMQEGYFYVEITTIISPSGSNSAVGIFTISTNYYLKEGDEITLYKYNPFSGNTPIKETVTSIKANSIELKQKL